MMGQQNYQPPLFSTVQIETLVPKDHLLRKVDSVLDLGFIRALAKNFYCQNNGRPSIDPALYVRMLILTFLYNITSDRKLCEEITYNLAYRWFCRLSIEDKVPDHSSMTRIRDRLGEGIFEKIFEKVLELCVQNGLVEAKELMMDGSLIRADASLKSIVKREQNPDRNRNQDKLTKKISNQTHVSASDPDSDLTGKIGQSKFLGYKVHNSIDPFARVIVDTHITKGSEMEGKVFLERLDHIESKFQYNVDLLTADRGYGYGENLQILKDRGKKTFVPNFHADVGGNIEKLGFIVDKKRNRMFCPKGYEFVEKTTPSMINKIKVYSGKQGMCRGCDHLKTCFPKGTINYRKKITVNIHHKIQAETKVREKMPEFRAKMRERMWKIEGIFGEAKNSHCLSRARYRGKSKMQIQAYLIATIQNLKRMISPTWLMSKTLLFLLEKSLNQKRHKINRTLGFSTAPNDFDAPKTRLLTFEKSRGYTTTFEEVFDTPSRLLWTALGQISSLLAIARIERPSVLRTRIFLSSLVLGLPKRFPFLTAFLRPARTLSLRRADSNSAKEDKMPRNILPCGVVMSRPESLSETTAMPRASNSWSPFMQSLIERNIRSSFQNKRTSNFLFLASLISRLRAFLLSVVVPENLSSYTSVISQPLTFAYSVISSTCMSVLWPLSSVLTRTYNATLFFSGIETSKVTSILPWALARFGHYFRRMKAFLEQKNREGGRYIGGQAKENFFHAISLGLSSTRSIFCKIKIPSRGGAFNIMTRELKRFEARAGKIIFWKTREV